MEGVEIGSREGEDIIAGRWAGRGGAAVLTVVARASLVTRE